MSEAVIFDSAQQLTDAFGEPEQVATKPSGWFKRMVDFYLAHHDAARRADPERSHIDRSPRAFATSAVRKACIQSAVTGAVAGAAATAASAFSLETEGAGALIAVPLAAAVMGGELALRTWIHVELTCRIAEGFGMPIDPTRTQDLWRLYTLAFRSERPESDAASSGRQHLLNLLRTQAGPAGERIGKRLVGESLARNVVPFVGIASSAVTNYLLTRKLGNTVRRYMRYQKAMDHALDAASRHTPQILDLLIEGLWFMFSADGRLSAEEAAFLAHELDRLEAAERRAVVARFTEDEFDWLQRIRTEVPESLRESFYHVLEAAAAVDKHVSIAERRILRHVARAFGCKYDRGRLRHMATSVEQTGTLSSADAAALSFG